MTFFMQILVITMNQSSQWQVMTFMSTWYIFASSSAREFHAYPCMNLSKNDETPAKHWFPRASSVLLDLLWMFGGYL